MNAIEKVSLMIKSMQMSIEWDKARKLLKSNTSKSWYKFHLSKSERKGKTASEIQSMRKQMFFELI